ncbi:TIGR03745 family integrating conjugative element membrane protein [Pseudomonas sp. S75]|uniref:TIGR03745 family integrating conjugative element membrane protein n=1 Tax=Pseudomonas sp. S75 TaxID=2767446 RepID=UPI001909A7AD|nr:TIGR03745 family integrating conjugative element membrane protein [Pseudomonas sp. S75]MBK0155557.1 TIGR03745 family integrating conjugative element membrane protein [Pseudomonas sp. S75]
MSLRTITKSLASAPALILGLHPVIAAAALPAAQAPTRGEGSNMLQTIQNYGYDAFMLIGLLLLGGMMVGVSAHAYGVYHDIHEGKKKWRDLGLTAVVGICLIGIGIFMVTKATGVL